MGEEPNSPAVKGLIKGLLRRVTPNASGFPAADGRGGEARRGRRPGGEAERGGGQAQEGHRVRREPVPLETWRQS
eukprot:415338-Prorocentrum_minimum.AAC.2